MNEKDQQLVRFQTELIQLVNALRKLQHNGDGFVNISGSNDSSTSDGGYSERKRN